MPVVAAALAEEEVTETAAALEASLMAVLLGLMTLLVVGTELEIKVLLGMELEVVPTLAISLDDDDWWLPLHDRLLDTCLVPGVVNLSN